MLVTYFGQIMQLALGKGIAVLGVGLLVIVVWRSRGPGVASLSLLAIAILIYPNAILTLATSRLDVRTAVASANIELATYHLALVATLALLPHAIRRRNLCMPLVIAPPAMYVVAAVQDDIPIHVLSGILQWAWAALAWACGSALAEERRAGRLPSKDVVWILALAVTANAIVSGLQLAGLWRVSTVSVGADVIERVSGLQDHSGNLGKLLLLFLLLLLPLTLSVVPGVVRLAAFSVLACFVTTGFTYSRANTAAVVSALGVWYILRPGGAGIHRVVVPAVIAVAAVPFVSVLLLRDRFDPSGGSRPILAEAAREQLHMTFWQGVGPNDYERTVGQFSPISLQLPVHNALMLTLVEAGAITTLVIAIPFIRLVARSFRTRRAVGYEGAQATAMIAVLPGLLAIAVTGHGLAYGQLMLFLFLVCGLVFKSMEQASQSDGRPGAKAGQAPVDDRRPIIRTAR